MTTTNPVDAAKALIRKHVAKAIGAEVDDIRLTARTTWQGSRDYDIRYDFVVKWHKPEASPLDEEGNPKGPNSTVQWVLGLGQEKNDGTHQGVVHSVYGQADRAVIFGGHYDMDAAECRDDFAARVKKLWAKGVPA